MSQHDEGKGGAVAWGMGSVKYGGVISAHVYGRESEARWVVDKWNREDGQRVDAPYRVVPLYATPPAPARTYEQGGALLKEARAAMGYHQGYTDLKMRIDEYLRALQVKGGE